MAIAAADANLFIHHHKTVFPFMHGGARADFNAGRILAMVASDGQIIGKDVLMIAVAILLPVAAGIFINTTKTNLRRQVFIILASQLAGFTAGETFVINIKSVLSTHYRLPTPYLSG